MGDAVHAGAIREALRILAGRARPTVVKVTGHAREKGIDIPPADAIGNEAAGEGARLGRLMHPQPTAKQLKDLAELWLKDTAVGKLAGQVLNLWQKRSRSELSPPQVGRLRPRKSQVQGTPHQWGFAWGKWQCLVCSRFGKDPLSSANLHSSCPGINHTFRRMLANPQGHSLARFSSAGQAFLICLRCGGWSHCRAYILDHRCCRAPLPAGKTTLSRVRRGLYPHLDHRFDELRVEAIFPLMGYIAPAQGSIQPDPWHLGPEIHPGHMEVFKEY